MHSKSNVGFNLQTQVALILDNFQIPLVIWCLSLCFSSEICIEREYACVREIEREREKDFKREREREPLFNLSWEHTARRALIKLI